MPDQPKRGEIWVIDLGEEKTQPCLIISGDQINIPEAPTVIVLPIFEMALGFPSRVPIRGVGGKDFRSQFIACEQIRSIKRTRLKEPKGMVSHETLEDCTLVLTRLIGLKPAPQRRGWSV